MSQPSSRRPVWRLLTAAGVSLAVVGGAWLVPSYGGPNGTPRTQAQKSYQAAAQAAVDAQVAAMVDQGTIWLPNGTHVHTDGASVKDGKVVFDPAEKNAISRTNLTTGDPTTAAQAKVNRTAAARQRAMAEPAMVGKRLLPPRLSVAQNRYAMANGCYAIRNVRTGQYLSDVQSTPRFRVKVKGNASPIFFKPTDLGTYLLWTKQATMLSNQGATLTTVPKPGAAAVWTATYVRPGQFRLATKTLSVAPLRFETTTGCKPFPEASTNVSGQPTGGLTSQQEVRGYIDAHTHGMAYQFLGGMVHCGKPWDQYGVTVALRDCADHELTGGKGAVMEGFLSGDLDGHDPVGWPTFKDWPAPQSLTHEGTYYKWMERSWRGGQRILVNLLVENNQLCLLYPLKKNSCDDMDSIRLQAKNMRQLERYIDAQSGGPGKGWYRIVRTPDQARRVINSGKLAVVMGIETSVPFKCSQKLGIPQCTKAQIDGFLNEMQKLGVAQMELVNKFDNALSGVAGDAGETGLLVNAANTLETLSPWRMQTCNPNNTEVHDKNQYAAPVGVPAEQQDALFGAVLKVSGVNLPALPVYPPPNHCNALGLSALGEHTIRGLAKRHMLFDPDHMSVKARKAALDVTESMGYPGVLSSHSWSTVDAYPRILKAKGFIAPYAGDSDGFVAKWRRHLNWANPKTYWGIGFGADINGLGAQGNPRKNNKNPVTYPFKGLGGVTVHRQVSGQRVYDINKDGVAQYGLYPDWVEDLRKQAGSAIVKDLARGPEAYLQTWERAYGIKPNACTNGGRLTARKILGVKRGTTAWNVLRQLGQPDRRLGSYFSYCSQSGKVKVLFKGGRVSSTKRV
ncbi:MAG: hypothetical protein EOO74_00320 [Myxococcales bacterium]|nr:MAG: hypothetical protein EOO74_00320 [Myxococcales bacterium]